MSLQRVEHYWDKTKDGWPTQMPWAGVPHDVLSCPTPRIVESRLSIEDTVRRIVRDKLRQALATDERFACGYLLEEESLSWELVVLASVGFKYSLLRELTGLTFEIQRELPRGVITVLLFGRGEFDENVFASRFGVGTKVK